MCLQKDMASVSIFLEQFQKKSSVEADLFSEVSFFDGTSFKKLHSSNKLEYLEKLRRKVYLNKHF
jgi:hypothetical protein